MPKQRFHLTTSSTLCLVFFVLATPLLAGVLPRFEDYEVRLYRGAIRPPRWIRHGGDGWRDNLEKLVEAPEINFAGKYFIAVHSCGTRCRYYTLTDLSSGRDRNLLGDFDSTEPPPKTRDGHQYLAFLVSRPNSKMLVAQYHVELSPGNEECWERVFLFEHEKIKAITSTQRSCRKF